MRGVRRGPLVKAYGNFGWVPEVDCDSDDRFLGTDYYAAIRCAAHGKLEYLYFPTPHSCGRREWEDVLPDPDEVEIFARLVCMARASTPHGHRMLVEKCLKKVRVYRDYHDYCRESYFSAGIREATTALRMAVTCIRFALGNTPEDAVRVLECASRVPPPQCLDQSVVYCKRIGEEWIRDEVETRYPSYAMSGLVRCLWFVLEAVAGGISSTCCEAKIVLEEACRSFEGVFQSGPWYDRCGIPAVHEYVPELFSKAVHLLKVRRFELALPPPADE